jgi:hypothetical protein
MTLSRPIGAGAGGFPRAVAHVVAAALVVTAMFAAAWAGPLPSASAGTEPAAASPSPAPVKFYIVPPPGNGHAESLFAVAARTLGDGSRFMEIFSLNEGRLQPNGGRLTNPRLIEPGWILQLPADAAGPGVRFGPLPVVTPIASQPRSRSGGADSALMISGAALAFLTAGLAFGVVRRRAGPAVGRRPSHARVPDSGAGGQSPAHGSGGAGGEWRQVPRDDHDRPMASPSASAPRADLAPRAGPMFQGRAAGVLDQVQLRAAPARPEAARVRSEPGRIWDVSSIQLAGRILTEADQQAAEIKHEARGQAATSLADARQEAAELIRRASDQAAATLAAADLQAAEVRAAVTKLSGELGAVAAYVTENLLTSAPSATTPAIRPAVQTVTGPAPEPEAEPKARPAVKPAARPGTRPAAKPRAQPAAKPRAQPAAKPRAQPAAKPKGRTRQQVAMRVTTIAAAALVLFALISGTTELALHGYRFFVFRSAGTGETPSSGLQEDQGPGQPDAHKRMPSHTKAQPSPHSTVTVHNGQ